MTTFGSLISGQAFKAEEIDLEDTPQRFFAKIREGRRCGYLLESARGESRLAEYSFVGFDPVKTVTVRDGKAEVRDEETGYTEKFTFEDPLSIIKGLVPPNSASALFRFSGGAVGYVSYDSVRYWERTLRSRLPGDSMPDMEFGIFNDGVVFDHTIGKSYYYTLGRSRAREVTEAARRGGERYPLEVSEFRLSHSKEKFEEMVRQAKKYVQAGDIFQVVLSKRYEFEADGGLLSFYEALSKINPSPYMYFVEFGDRKIVGSSPEMLLRVEDRRVETYPIAGTRQVSGNKKKDRRLADELLSDVKERAEHVMLVDLARNDVGKVSKYGSVKVPEFFTVQKFSHVQHIVSHVVGEMRDGVDSYDALRSLFPAGTVSGAPKVRAMEIIDELESVKRGPYAGAVGYFSFNGNADFAITIRTLVADGKKCAVQAGAGIVADSIPEREWEETEAKAAGVMKAVRLACDNR